MQKGIPFEKRKATRLKPEDYKKYDYIIGMEESNIRNIKKILGEDYNNKVYTLLDFSNNPRDIADPWYTRNFNNSIEMANLLNDENITKILTVENYKEDGKEFKNTKAYLSETIQKLEDCKNKYYEFFTEEKTMSYINDKNLDSYYIDFYKNEIVADTETEGNDKTVENAINSTISTLKASEKIIDFLIENKNSWEIQDDNIAFSSDSLANKYNELASNL